MRSIIEFALFAWVAISVIAVVVQVLRIARYKRSNRGDASVQTSDVRPEPATIDLAERLSATQPPTAPETSPAQVLSGAATAEQVVPPTQAPQSPPPSAPNTATPKITMPTAPAAPTSPAPAESLPTERVTTEPLAIPTAPTAPPASPPSAAPAAAEAAPLSDTASTPEPAPAEPAGPTLADLLAGVRLPWNLLPAVDQSREPSNDRVVLITSEGEPSAIGVDVADELERLGFAIAPRGDDTAVATRDGHALGLQIIEEPMTAEVDGVRRFPTATESSVALDIWVETNAPN